jgi:hypothetical protein
VFDHNQPTGQAGTVIARRTLTAVTPAGVGLPFRELEVSDSRGQRRLVWLEYRVAGRLTADDLHAKALQVGGAIRGRRDAQALVLTANCDNGCEAARSWLSDFAIAASQALYDEAERSVASP